MRITKVTLDQRYIPNVGSAHYPTTCTVTVGGDDLEASWQRVEHQLSPLQTKRVCEYIAAMILVDAELDLTFTVPTEAEIAAIIEAKELEQRRKDEQAERDIAETLALEEKADEAAYNNEVEA